MKVTLLGSGTPAPNPRRAQAAVLVETGEHRVLVDAGRGVLTQLARAGVDPATVNPVLITHHHADHINDLFDLILTSALCGRPGALEVIGPPGTAAIVRGLLDHVFARDIRSRVEADGHDPDAPSARIAQVDARDVEPGAAWTRGGVRIVAGEVLHGAYPDFADWRCYGYRIEAEGRIVAVSGDTVPCPGVIDLARDADLLVQCCHFPPGAEADPDVAAMTRDTLPSATQAGEIARDANAKRVVLTHLSARIDGPDAEADVAAAVGASFNGEIHVGRDLLAVGL